MCVCDDDISADKHVFTDCILVKPNTTVREFAKMVHPDIERHYQYAETIGAIRVRFHLFEVFGGGRGLRKGLLFVWRDDAFRRMNSSIDQHFLFPYNPEF